MSENHSVRGTASSQMWRSLDRYLGRGSYYWLKDRIHPQREYTQRTYARLIDEVLTPQTRWLDAGGGYKILEVTSPEGGLGGGGRGRAAGGVGPVLHGI